MTIKQLSQEFLEQNPFFKMGKLDAQGLPKRLGFGEPMWEGVSGFLATGDEEVDVATAIAIKLKQQGIFIEPSKLMDGTVKFSDNFDISDVELHFRK